MLILIIHYKLTQQTCLKIDINYIMLLVFGSIDHQLTSSCL